jgi:hypothetical protein
MLGRSLSKVDLRYCKNIDEIRSTIAKFAARHPSASIIFARGWIQDVTDGKALASMLDGVDPRPIFIDANDLHSTWCNYPALESLDLDGTPDPHGGRILRDEQGKASGLLLESATSEIVWPYIARCTAKDERVDHITQALSAYASAGYSGLIDMAMGEEDWETLQELNTQGKLKCWIRAHWLIYPRSSTQENLAQIDRAVELRNQTGDNNLRIAGIKLICDGVVDSCTASLVEPYALDRSNCEPIWSEAALEPVVRYADAAGLQCAFHAIGDRTINMVLNVLETCASPGRRHRIEHLEVTRAEDAARLGALAITASVQPVHSDPEIFHAWPKLLGEQRCKRAFAYKEFADHGATIAIGTDAPTAPYSALENLYIASTRRSAKSPQSLATTNQNFALPLHSALAAATKGASYSCFMEDQTGQLNVGQRADFAVLDVEWKPESLLMGHVSQTWNYGQKVYDREVRR